jgi:hypothetical protein
MPTLPMATTTDIAQIALAQKQAQQRKLYLLLGLAVIAFFALGKSRGSRRW